MFVLAVCAAFSLPSCSMFTYPTYSVSLYKVESLENAKQQFGETKIVNSNEENLTKYTFEDDYIRITWFVTRTQFDFYLYNKSQHSIKIPWDDMVYVDVAGHTGRVMHSGVKYIDRNSSQPASVVPKGASLSDIIMPTDNVYYVSGQYGGWSEHPLLPKFTTTEEIRSSHIVGKTMKILFPVIIENVTNEYTFEFRVDDAVIK
jgi:hypothetical protein